jgi:hypothetical protein
MLRFFEDYGVEHPQAGVFIVGTLNFHLAMEDRSTTFDGPYGVCDSLDQLRRHSLWEEIERDPRAMALVLTPVRRSDQEESGGWRWHKWGEYVGDQEPQCEYIFDEPVVELVYVFKAVVLDKGSELGRGLAPCLS